MPVIRRTQPTTALPRPSYPIASRAWVLQARGLNARQVSAAHPPVPGPRGAAYNPHAKRVQIRRKP